MITELQMLNNIEKEALRRWPDHTSKEDDDSPIWLDLSDDRANFLEHISWFLSTLRVEELSELLIEHQYREFPAGNCLCGVDGIATTGSHENHVAQIIIKHISK